MITIRDRKLLGAGAIILLFSIIILQLPLLNYLGYEFSVAVALIVPFLSAYLVISGVRSRGAAVEKITASGLRAATSVALGRGFLLLLLPFIAASLNILRVRNCSYWDGVIFYLLIPCITCFWSVALAGFCVALTGQKVHTRPLATFVLFTAIVGMVMVYPLYLAYATPQIYSYNFIYGFFPGLSYDEKIGRAHV